MMDALKRTLRTLFLWLEKALDGAFGAAANPLVHLGGLGWFLFWIITVTGIYVYIFFDSGVTQAWESMESLSTQQWYLGGVMRSLHRYASDALVIVVVLHLLREFAFDRMRGNRWFPWVTGVPLLWFLYASGITGYWLVWDELAQFVAVVTSEWLDSLGIFAEPIARNFLSGRHLSGRFFTLMVYIHIAVPLIMLLLMWVHIQRHAHARVNPPRALGTSVLAALLLLSLVVPAMSQARADLDRVPFQVGLDWFYLAIYPLLEVVGGGTMWAALVGLSVLLALLPWLPRAARAEPARVHLENCNGCGRCFADCPFGAITMTRRTDGAAFEQEALVDPDQCMSCGICVGACPTATPFRRAGALVAGIELPSLSVAGLRELVIASGPPAADRPRVLVFSCGHTADTEALVDADTRVIRLPCVGMLPPSFIDFVLSRRHAEGVMIAGCVEKDCYERLGNTWTEQRIAGERDPNLRARVPRARVRVSWASPLQLAQHEAALAGLRESLTTDAAVATGGTGGAVWRPALPRLPMPLRIAGQTLVLAVVAVSIGWFATRPSHAWLAADQAVVKLSFSHAGQPLKPCRRRSHEELMDLPLEERFATTCERGRWPIQVEFDLDGRRVYTGTHEPAGLWNDGPSTVYRRFRLPAGEHHVSLRLRDSGREEGFDYAASGTINLEAGRNFVIEFRSSDGGFDIGGMPLPAAPTMEGSP